MVCPITKQKTELLGRNGPVIKSVMLCTYVSACVRSGSRGSRATVQWWGEREWMPSWSTSPTMARTTCAGSDQWRSPALCRHAAAAGIPQSFSCQQTETRMIRQMCGSNRDHHHQTTSSNIYTGCLSLQIQPNKFSKRFPDDFYLTS